MVKIGSVNKILLLLFLLLLSVADNLYQLILPSFSFILCSGAYKGLNMSCIDITLVLTTMWCQFLHKDVSMLLHGQNHAKKWYQRWRHRNFWFHSWGKFVRSSNQPGFSMFSIPWLSSKPSLQHFPHQRLMRRLFSWLLSSNGLGFRNRRWLNL